MSGGEAGVFPRGAAKHWLAPGENGGSGTFSHMGGGLGLFSGVSSIWNSRGKPEDAKPLGGGRVGGREALIRELGLSETTASLGTGTSPGFCPLHSSFWGLDSGEGLESAGAFLIPSAWRRLPSVLMGSFV